MILAKLTFSSSIFKKLSCSGFDVIMTKTIQKGIAFIKNSGIFASTVLATLPLRTASQGESFAFIPFLFQIIHLPCLSLMHTWRVFLFWQKSSEVL